MRTTVHKTSFRATCPLRCDDIYDAEFHTGDRIVMVDEIAEARGDDGETEWFDEEHR